MNRREFSALALPVATITALTPKALAAINQPLTVRAIRDHLNQRCVELGAKIDASCYLYLVEEARDAFSRRESSSGGWAVFETAPGLFRISLHCMVPIRPSKDADAVATNYQPPYSFKLSSNLKSWDVAEQDIKACIAHMMDVLAFPPGTFDEMAKRIGDSQGRLWSKA